MYMSLVTTVCSPGVLVLMHVDLVHFHECESHIDKRCSLKYYCSRVVLLNYKIQQETFITVLSQIQLGSISRLQLTISL